MKIVIIGGGIVGLASAYKLIAKFGSKIDLTLVEKEKEVAMHQSSRNSGVLHAGLAYKPGSYKAILSTSGIRQMVGFCQENDIAFEQCGKLVLATKPVEIEGIKRLYEIGKKNGLKGLQLLNAEESLEREPLANPCPGLLVPEEGICDYHAVCIRLKQKIVDMGGQVLTEFQFRKLIKVPGSQIIIARDGREIETDFTISCAGLYADRIARIFNVDPGMKIIPFRGDYYHLKKDSDVRVRHLIYPVADPKYPFLGVHFTRRVDGSVEAGPNAVLAFAREGYKIRNINALDMSDALGYKGLRNFVFRHKHMVVKELQSSYHKNSFLRRLQRLVPSITSKDLDKGNSGVRAQAMDRRGNLVGDFVIRSSEKSLHLINAPSPAATSSLAIGDWICSEFERINRFKL